MFSWVLGSSHLMSFSSTPTISSKQLKQIKLLTLLLEKAWAVSKHAIDEIILESKISNFEQVNTIARTCMGA